MPTGRMPSATCGMWRRAFFPENQSVEKQTEDVVNQVKKYIVEHLDGDTSLYNLAEQVHFSQEYLLRIFKKKKGLPSFSISMT